MNWNTKDDLRCCLRSLQQYPFTRGSQEIVVVDNASKDGSVEMVRAEFPEALLFTNSSNENFARGTNRAVEIAQGDLLLLLNPDVEITEGALDVLADVLINDFTCAASAPKLIHADGSVQRSVRGFPDPWSLLWDIFGLARLFPANPRFGAYRQNRFDYNRPGTAPQPMASCFLIRRNAWNRIGPMDERFPLFFNDSDWCLRCYQAGLKIGYTPDACVLHGGAGTTKKVRTAAIWESHRALLRFYDKHYRETTPRILYVLLTMLITLGAWARTKRWGESLGRNGGETTPESLRRELERQG